MAQCVTKVELHISCRGLLDKDTMSKSDPIAVVFTQDKGGKWYEFARTERVKNSLNPDFSQAITIDYYFEMVQKLKFSVFDVDNATKKLDDDDFLGEMECTLGQIVSKRSFSKHLEIKQRQVGTITVYAEEIKGGNEIVKLTLRATNLDKKDFLGKSDPFVEISKVKTDEGLLMVHRTEVVKNNLNPHWKSFEIPVSTLCSGDYDGAIKMSCFDYDSDGTHDFIGFTTTSLRQLIDMARTGKGLDLINPKKQSKKKYVNSGVLYVSHCEISHYYSFLDYVMGGCQINFTVGIDFTGSNGDPSHPQSLHYMNPYEPNEYLKALTAVGEVCQDYDTDKLFPAFGFGAQVPPNMRVSHQFAINFQDTNPYCQGITGVVAAYQACISQVRLYGPTNASPIIRHVTQFAYRAGQEGNASQYFILLLLTDGVLSDMEETKMAIVRASKVPMSIIIVGVGPADFTDMNELDADDGLLRAGTEIAERDIVQFVPFRDFKGQSPVVLAQHVLAEVPKQVQSYFNKRKIPPMNPQGPDPPSLAGL